MCIHICRYVYKYIYIYIYIPVMSDCEVDACCCCASGSQRLSSIGAKDTDPSFDDNDDDDGYLRLQHGKGFHNLVYMSYVYINLASKA
jgi:hypothetical protein